MSRKFIGLVAAFSIAVTGFSAAPARAASDEDVARFLAGLVALGVIAAAVDSSDRTKKKKTYTKPRREVRQDHWREERRERRHGARGRNILPVDCLRVANTGGDRMRYFPRGCLKRNYSHVGSLPRFCRTNVTKSNGRTIKAYHARCLRNEGYRLSRR